MRRRRIHRDVEVVLTPDSWVYEVVRELADDRLQREYGLACYGRAYRLGVPRPEIYFDLAVQRAWAEWQLLGGQASPENPRFIALLTAVIAGKVTHALAWRYPKNARNTEHASKRGWKAFVKPSLESHTAAPTASTWIR